MSPYGYRGPRMSVGLQLVLLTFGALAWLVVWSWRFMRKRAPGWQGPTLVVVVVLAVAWLRLTAPR